MAKQLADKSSGKYTQSQIEDQMRIMGVGVNGTSESGAPTTLISQPPTDSGAHWISAGTTTDGKPILTQITVRANPELQLYILSNYVTDVPSTILYDPLSGSKSSSITGPFTKFDRSDGDYMRNTVADTASMVSTNAGRLGSAAATAATLPTPYTPIYEGIAFGAAVTGWVADFTAQTARPNPGSYMTGGVVDLALEGAAKKYPLAGPLFTEFGNWIKNTKTFIDVSNKINNTKKNK